jgi:hypothetical protein
MKERRSSSDAYMEACALASPDGWGRQRLANTPPASVGRAQSAQDCSGLRSCAFLAVQPATSPVPHRWALTRRLPACRRSPPLPFEKVTRRMPVFQPTAPRSSGVRASRTNTHAFRICSSAVFPAMKGRQPSTRDLVSLSVSRPRRTPTMTDIWRRGCPSRRASSKARAAM